MGEKILSLFYYVKAENFIETTIVKNKIIKLSDKKSNFLTNNIFYAVKKTLEKNYSNTSKMERYLKYLNNKLIIDIKKNNRLEKNLIDTIKECQKRPRNPLLLGECLSILKASEKSINNAKTYMEKIGYNLNCKEMQVF